MGFFFGCFSKTPLCFGTIIPKTPLCFGRKYTIIPSLHKYSGDEVVSLYRFEQEYLNSWFNRSHKKPLIIKGARQVGKSTLVRLFAKQHDFDLVEINFEQSPDNASFFKSNDPVKILSLLSTYFEKKINPERSLLFLDEIQKTPEVLISLRYFYEKMPELAVISAGSLLDLALTEINFSIPVGRIEYLYIGSMSFQAFLLALGKNQLVEFIRNYKLGEDFPLAIHEKIIELLKIYFVIGGLPEAVERYVATNNFVEVERIKRGLINSYQEDFAKYANRSQQHRMQLIFNKVPRILGEKFKYSNISRDDKSIEIKKALDNLVLAKIVNCVFHTNANGLPLGAEVNEKYFKTYFLDVGLVSSALDLDVLNFTDNQDVTFINSGKIAEQFIAQHLLYFRNINEIPSLYYWSREQKSASAEIDFLVAYRGNVIPIEVKAGSSGSLKSLHYFLQKKSLSLGVRFCSQIPSLTTEQILFPTKVVKKYQLLSLPLYMVEELARLLGEVGKRNFIDN